MGPKKPKKTKEQLEEERLAREEEARLAAEAEKKRLAEEAERARIEAERIAAENLATRIAEIETLVPEYEKYMTELDKRKNLTTKEEEKYLAEIEWEKYRNPSTALDVTNDIDINTFITLTKESISSSTDVDSTMAFASQLSLLVEDTEVLWANSLGSNDSKKCQDAISYINEFYEILKGKIDAMTLSLLNKADQHLNDRGEYQFEKVVDKFAFGVWVSLNDMRPVRKSVHFDEMGLQIDIPKQILSQDAKFVHRAMRIPIDTFSTLAFSDIAGGNIHPLARSIVVGDVYIMDILFPPPQPFDIRAKKWIIRDQAPIVQELRYSDYPSSVPCKCILTVPNYIVMSDDVRIAYLDPKTGMWSEDHCSDYTYNDETRHCTFSTTSLGVFAFIKRRNADFPYKSWSLCAQCTISNTNENFERESRLTIQTQNYNIVIDIQGTQCFLKEPALPEVKDLIGSGMSPGALILKLQKRGINILPSLFDPIDTEGIKKPLKDSDLELVVIEEMARSSSAMDFVSTPWNTLEQMGPSRIGLCVREASSYIGFIDDKLDNECILIEKDSISESYVNCSEKGLLPGVGARYTLVMGNEYGDVEEYSHKSRPFAVTKINLLDAVGERLTPESRDRASRTNGRFELTVKTLLKLVRPLVLCE